MDYEYLKNTPDSHEVLRNGVVLTSFVREESPLTKLVMVNKFTSYEYDANVIYLTGKMLLEGTHHHTHSELSEMIDFYGSEVKVSNDLDANILSITVLNEYLKNLLDIIKEIFEDQLFSTERLEIMKAKAIESLKIENSRNTTRAIKKLRQILYPEDHPYGSIRSEEGLRKVSIEDIKSCFSKLWKNKSEILITGPSYNIEYVKGKMSDILFCDGDRQMSKISIVRSSPCEERIKDKNCQQVHIALGNITIPVTHEDYLKLLCTVAFFGGGYLGSRLMQVIREKKGLTYGISASIVTMCYSNFLCIYTSAKKAFKDEILHTIDKEIERLKTEVVKDSELDNFKKYYCGDIISSFTDIFSKMHHMISTKILQMQDSYYYDLFMTVKNLTAEDIQTCAVKYLNYKNFSQVFIE